MPKEYYFELPIKHNSSNLGKNHRPNKRVHFTKEAFYAVADPAFLTLYVQKFFEFTPGTTFRKICMSKRKNWDSQRQFTLRVCICICDCFL